MYNKYMEKINLKAVSPETRKIIKKQVISMLKKHMNHQEIADITGISKPAVDKIACAYKKEGTACLKEKKRGRKAGEKRQLTSAQGRDFLSLYFKMTYFPLLSHFSASYNQSNNTFKLIKAPEFVVPLSYGTQFVVLSVSPSRTLS